MVILHIGFDDTDSPRKGCTTYICAILVEEFLDLGVKFKDYPLLIRLNPNIPFKTRGNGCVGLRLEVDEAKVDIIKRIVLKKISQFADLSFNGTDPGVAFLIGNVPRELKNLSEKTLHDLVSLEDAVKLAEKCGVEVHMFKQGMGIIGALAAIGATLEEDHTYELIAYRKPENWGKPRKVDLESIKLMDHLTSPETFNNIDGDRVLITPHGPDPVLYGIRGENPEVVYKAHSLIKVYEPIERWVIFRSNQGTDAHLRVKRKINELRPYISTIIEGVVSSKPIITQGGHVFIKISDETGEINCAAYEPTGAFRWVINDLIPGDVVRVYGGIRPPSPHHPMTLNIEKIEILKLAPLVKTRNPLCPRCSKRTSSAGKGQGFKCKKCGEKIFAEKIIEVSHRKIAESVYIPPPRAQRHLTRPYTRFNRQNAPPTELFKYWCSRLVSIP